MNKDIVCIGAGYIGGPTMAVIALKNPGRRVVVVDINEARIAAWNSPDFDLPVYEPGLLDVVRQVRGRNLFFSTDIETAVRECDIVFVGVNTPTKSFGRGAGMASDLQYWEATAREIKRFARGDKIVVEKSTLPVRTAAAMEAILNDHSEHKFTVLSNPEFLAEGTAIRDLLEPDRVLVGGPDDADGRAAVEECVSIYASWVPRERILTTGVWSAELTKLAANAFLAQRVSSINAIAGLCEATGADVDEVARVIGADRRIGPKFLKAGPGFGGSCFKKDVLNLVYLCESFGLHTAAEYWHGVVKMNEHQQERIVSRLVKQMFNTVANKKIALFGFAFKADTGDTRETPSATVAKLLAEEHARIAVTDPKAIPNARRDLEGVPGVEFCDGEYEAAAGADAIVLMTDWRHYKDLDWNRIFESMRKPALVFDTRNCLDQARLREIGFRVLAIGK
ncbi:MAG: nucleotide sugar dehydrogenase [Kiritimatiellae bacterium]|nr:nucleotide sugar dehydrogenase [Kiritimatiellia bacterium]MBR1837875.1 nucleotide sugar dehydrogenase [Kiritimatiellia bacterium]